MNEKETMNEVRRVLSNFEKLVEAETELETKLSDKSHLIESQKQAFLQISSSNNGDIELKSQLIKHESIQQTQIQQFIKEKNYSVIIAKLQGQLTAKDEIIGKLIERPDENLT